MSRYKRIRKHNKKELQNTIASLEQQLANEKANKAELEKANSRFK